MAEEYLAIRHAPHLDKPRSQASEQPLNPICHQPSRFALSPLSNMKLETASTMELNKTCLAHRASHRRVDTYAAHEPLLGALQLQPSIKTTDHILHTDGSGFEVLASAC